MSSHSAAAEAAARRLMAAAIGAEPAADDPDAITHRMVAAERTSAEVGSILARWFGPYGYHALLSRALIQAQGRHPSLATVAIRSPRVPVLDGLHEAGASYGGEAVAEAVTDVLAGVVGLLARVIGEDMALQLLERSMEEPGRDVPSRGTSTPDPDRAGGG